MLERWNITLAVLWRAIRSIVLGFLNKSSAKSEITNMVATGLKIEMLRCYVKRMSTFLILLPSCSFFYLELVGNLHTLFGLRRHLLNMADYCRE